MKSVEQRKAAAEFVKHWTGRGGEKQDCQSYWSEMLSNVFGVSAPSMYVAFEKPLPKGYIDAYIPETKVLIEQKGLGIDLDAKEPRQKKLVTPYEQARDYVAQLPLNEKPKYIITCNFATIRIYDTNEKESYSYKTDTWSAPYEEVKLADFETEYSRLSFLVDEHEQQIRKEMELSLQAGELVGKIHDRFLEQYHDPMAKKTQSSLNILCVRLVFCLYAEDAGLFGEHDAFSRYIGQYEPKDIRRALLDLFKVLDTKITDRDEYLEDELAAFPYVNGGLFARENIEIPKITQEIKDTILESAKFNWAEISPTIFGAVFESTLNPVTRRSGGMHYTSIENIHKVIDPLFLGDLKTELQEIEQIAVLKTKKQKLEAFQKKLSSLIFFDPACGSGNFLTETYLSIRRLENQVIKDLSGGQMTFGEAINPIQVSINQFYGIEINDFAVTVAKTALWIAESQMFSETEDILYQHMDFLPLKTNANIVEGNALQLDWEKIVPKYKLSYLYGNPPFVGKKEQSKEQKEELIEVIGKDVRGVGNLDYVTAWYIKAANMIRYTNIKAAFVSTNSITQGEQAPVFGNELYKHGMQISFAYRTFRWDSEASTKAHVHCVIIGFCDSGSHIDHVIYDSDGSKKKTASINPYLIDGPFVIVKTRTTPLFEAPPISYGSMPIDDGHLILNEEDVKAIISESPACEKYIKEYAGGEELLKGKKRWCLWLQNAAPADIAESKTIMNRIKETREFRLQSKRPQTLVLAEAPSLFGEIRQPETDMLVIPKVSSETRRYIPVSYVKPFVIVNGSALIIPNASLYTFGIISSNVHMSWMRTVAGRMKSDYQYSGNIVYNNFPWPSPTDKQKNLIEATAQEILNAREKYTNIPLGKLYTPEILMTATDLYKAHIRNDIAVMGAYGFNKGTPEFSSEAACVAALMKMYQEKISEEQNKQEK